MTKFIKTVTLANTKAAMSACVKHDIKGDGLIDSLARHLMALRLNGDVASIEVIQADNKGVNRSQGVARALSATKKLHEFLRDDVTIYANAKLDEVLTLKDFTETAERDFPIKLETIERYTRNGIKRDAAKKAKQAQEEAVESEPKQTPQEPSESDSVDFEKQIKGAFATILADDLEKAQALVDELNLMIMEVEENQPETQAA